MKKIPILVLTLMLLLMGCAKEKEEVWDGVPSAETDFQSEYNDRSAFGYAHPIVEVEKGYYILAGYYIYYVDKETMECVPLCNKPNCLHQKETDAMKVTECNAMVHASTLYSQSLNYYQGYLYIACQDAVAGEGGFVENKHVLYKLALDGSGKELVHVFSKPVKMAIVHRGYIYYTSDKADLPSEPVDVYRIPIKGGKEKKIYTVQNENAQIDYLQAIGNKVLFAEMEVDESIKIIMQEYDVITGKTEEISVGENLWACYANAVGERMYYQTYNAKEQKMCMMSTKLDGSDVRKEVVDAEWCDEDYYYSRNEERNIQNVYDKKGNKIAFFSLPYSQDAFFSGKDKLFRFEFVDREINGRQVELRISYINREDIPKGDAGVKVLMELTHEEAFPAIATKLY